MTQYVYLANRVLDKNGIADSSSIFFYLSGTTTLIDIYSDPDYTIQLPNPLRMVMGAAIPPVYWQEGSVRVVVVDSSGEIVSDDDPYSPFGVEALSAALAAGTGAELVGYEPAFSGAVLRSVRDKLSDFVSVADFGAVADTTITVNGTDNKAAFENALATGRPVIIPRPPTGMAYGVSQVSLPRNAVIIGPGTYVLAVRGLSTLATFTGGTSGADLRREITIIDLFVENNRGGDAVNLDWSPDWNFTRVYFRSVSNTAMGTVAQRGLNMKNCERGEFSGQCRFGGNPALRLVKDTNAVRGENICVSGGSAGRAVDITGCQNVRLRLTIETSLQGVRIGDNTGPNATDGGWCSGIDLSNSYFESVGEPIDAARFYAVSGLNLDNCWLNNGALSDGSPFPVTTETLKIGRVKNMSLIGGRWVGAGTETALRLMPPPGGATGITVLNNSNIDLTVFEQVAARFDPTTITNNNFRAIAAATNTIKTDTVGNAWGVPFEWISGVLDANVTIQRQISGTFPSGGQAISVELIEGSGSLEGAQVRVGSSANLASIVNKTFGAVSPAYELLFPGTGVALIRNDGGILYRVDAGTGLGKFRLRIRGVVGLV